MAYNYNCLFYENFTLLSISYNFFFPTFKSIETSDSEMHEIPEEVSSASANQELDTTYAKPNSNNSRSTSNSLSGGVYGGETHMHGRYCMSSSRSSRQHVSIRRSKEQHIGACKRGNASATIIQTSYASHMCPVANHWCITKAYVLFHLLAYESAYLMQTTNTQAYYSDIRRSGHPTAGKTYSLHVDSAYQRWPTIVRSFTGSSSSST